MIIAVFHKALVVFFTIKSSAIGNFIDRCYGRQKKRPLVETAALPRKMVIAIKTGVIKANEPKILKEFGGSLELTEGWARNVLKNMDWVKIKGTTAKVQSFVQRTLRKVFRGRTCHL